MSFLAGWTPILLAAGLTIPPLVLLYFLKLRRQPMSISSTLLWKRAVEDLQVNAPFQRIRNNLLLWLQLLVLMLAAVALGKPVLEALQRSEDSLILLIDQSASMAIEEADGKTRLDIAVDQARTAIDNLASGSRAMIIGFSDRATLVSPFETDTDVLKRKLADLATTDSTTTLSEAMVLAEAYMQNRDAAGDVADGADAPRQTIGPAKAIILTDGNIADARNLSVTRLPTDDLEIVSIGERADNVGILAMDARRNYDRPELLEVFALIQNFGPTPAELDATLYINGEPVDVQTMALQPGRERQPTTMPGGDVPGEPGTDGTSAGAPPAGSVASVAFDAFEYTGGGTVEVRLNHDDALAADNAAWTVIRPPRSVQILLVASGDVFLERVLDALPGTLEVMSPARYEAAPEDELMLAGRSIFDVVIIENHSTKRLPPGNYFFMGGVPEIDGVSADGYVADEIIFNWDETHPILRYVAVESIQVYRWLRLALPPETIVLMEGETSPIMGLLSRDGRQYLICGFGVLTEDEESGRQMYNTDWIVKAHFPVFMYNVVQYLAASMSPTGVRSIQPGEPIDFPVPALTDSILVRRPDGQADRVPTAGFDTVNYARTRRVGVYRATPGVDGEDVFAVNLFDRTESDVAPSRTLTLSGEQLEADATIQRVNQPIWPWLLLAILGVLMIEWVVYCKRVYV